MLTNYSDIQEERDGLRYVEVPQDHCRVIVAVPHGPDRGWSLLMFLGYHLLDYYLLVLLRPNDFKFVQRMYKPNEWLCKLTCVKGGRLAGRDG